MTATVSTPARPTPARGRTRRRLGRTAQVAIGVASVVATLLLWQAASLLGLLPASVVPPISAVLGALGEQLTTELFWVSLWQTVSSAFIGLLIVTAIAIPLSLAIGLSRFVRESTLVPIEFLKPIPPVALIPLTMLLWGPSITMKLFLIVLGALWPLLTQMVYGVREVSGIALQAAKSYRLGGWLTTTRVVIPSLLPFAATGMRVSAAVALIIAIVTEMVAGVPGLGQQITLTQLAGQLPTMYALILATGLLGLLVNGLLRLAERSVLFWHPSQRGEQS